MLTACVKYSTDLQASCRGGPPWPPHLTTSIGGVATEGHPYNWSYIANFTRYQIP